MSKLNLNEDSKTLKVTLLKSLIKCKASHKACAHGLGIKKIGQTAEVINTPENRGMVKQISYLVRVEQS